MYIQKSPFFYNLIACINSHDFYQINSCYLLVSPDWYGNLVNSKRIPLHAERYRRGASPVNTAALARFPGAAHHTQERLWGRESGRETNQPNLARTVAGDTGWERVTCMCRLCGVSERGSRGKELSQPVHHTTPLFETTLVVTTWVCALSVGVLLRLSHPSMLHSSI